ncbi:MAG: laccase domain-containing protein, partial [Nitrososphaerota archaeon]
MIRREEDGLKFYQSAILLEIGFRNYFFTRFGGESEGEFAELNLSFRVGDKPERVKKNREKVRRVIGGEKLIMVKEVNSGTVLDLDQKE